MTRFNISLQEGVDMVLWALENSVGGEIFVPKIPSYKITDLAEAIGPSCKKPIIGIRPGEKIHAEMITSSDSSNTIDLGKYYAIINMTGGMSSESYYKMKKAKKVPAGFYYNSGENPQFLTIREIQGLIKKNLGRQAVKRLLPMQPGDVSATYAKVDDLAQAVGFKPNTSIEEGLARFVDWYHMFYR